MPDACCKVATATAAYDLDQVAIEDDVDAYLVARWTGAAGYPRTGARALTEWFNKRILQAASEAGDRRALDAHLDAEYEALQSGDDITRGAIVDDLAEDGLDADAITADFVSHPTMYRHLTEHLEAEKPPREASPDWESDKVAHARQTARSNVEEALRSLENKGRLPEATAADLDVSIVLRCPECATQVRLEHALRRGFVCAEHLGRGGP